MIGKGHDNANPSSIEKKQWSDYYKQEAIAARYQAISGREPDTCRGVNCNVVFRGVVYSSTAQI